MESTLKNKIHQLVDTIEDENVLNIVMEDIVFYSTKKDIVDDLSDRQLNELNEAIKEANNNETVSWDSFKNEMKEWRKK
jgi:gas vesicle protein